jgi:hypothetical protein
LGMEGGWDEAPRLEIIRGLVDELTDLKGG